ncbi:MAG TPA: hypothetical protein VFT47_13290 [Vicinamibacterales bacterium]|nr:hypothetical protein [Vicinamibacterales bacterium]
MSHLISSAEGGYSFVRRARGRSRLTRHPEAPSTLPDPATGRALRISTVEVAGAICPSCDERSEGGFVSFEGDLRMVYACPECQELVWIHGA